MAAVIWPAGIRERPRRVLLYQLAQHLVYAIANYKDDICESLDIYSI